MAKIIYNGEYEKKAITDQFVENLGGMLEKDPDVIYLDADLMFAFGAVPSETPFAFAHSMPFWYHGLLPVVSSPA